MNHREYRLLKKDLFLLSFHRGTVRTRVSEGIGDMSSARNRGQSHLGPQVPPRILSRDLLESQDVLLAFDGYEPAGPQLQATVLQRPAKVGRPTLLQSFLRRGHHLLAAVQRRFMG